jgi:hypothetical protein
MDGTHCGTYASLDMGRIWDAQRKDAMRDEIDREFAQVLAEMTLLMYGPVSRFDKSGGRSSEHPGGKRPQGDSNPLHREFAERYARATGEAKRRETLNEAREALSGVLKRSEGAYVEETWEQLRDRIVKEGEGWALRDVAVALKVTETQARKARRQKDREVEFGLPTTERKELPNPERAVHLASQGLTQREIAAQLDCHKTQVARWLAKAA